MSVKPAHHYLDFTRKDRRGTMVLLAAILLLCIIPFIYPLFAKNSIADKIDIDSSVGIIQQQKIAARNKKSDPNVREEERRPYDYPSAHSSSYHPKKGELFYFDPNTISAEGWKKLGLRDKTITTIMNFRNKGGKFKQAADIKKIWGLFPDEAERLIPFINIAADETPGKNYPNHFSETKKYDGKRNYAPVNINSSDTSEWIALPGIGSKLSHRIISFRDKLGGFYSVNQVGETFGLPDSVFQKIKPLLQISGEVKKINLNTVSLEELKAHPYIRYQLGNAIIQYRAQHGNFKNITDIKKIMIIDETTYNKLSPYLTVD